MFENLVYPYSIFPHRSGPCQCILPNFNNPKAEQYIGKIHFEIKINQLGMIESKMFDYLDVRDCIILDYIYSIEKFYSKKNREQKITYDYLIKALPILKKLQSKSKASISRVIKKLENMDLLIVDRIKGRRNTYHLTESALEMLFFRIENTNQEHKEAVPPKEKHPVPNIEKHNSIKDRTNNNLYIEPKDFSDNNSESKIKKYSKEALEYFQSLIPEDRRLFDCRAFNLLDFSCPKPKPNTEEMKVLRIKNYIYENDL